MIDSITILRTFIIRKEEKAKRIIFILLENLMFGTERLKIRSKKYAAPATQASIISIGEEKLPIKIILPKSVESKIRLRIK